MIVSSLPEINSSFILPINALKRVRDDILFSGSVNYAWFGLMASERIFPMKAVK